MLLMVYYLSLVFFLSVVFNTAFHNIIPEPLQYLIAAIVVFPTTYYLVSKRVV